MEETLSEAKKKRAEFDALFEEYKKLIESLTEEEKIAAEVNGDQEHEKYANQFFFETAHRPLTEEKELDGALQGIKHCTGMIEGLRADVKKYHEKQKRIAGGITSVKLLARYLKLSEYWRGFVRGRLNRDGAGIATDEELRDNFADLKDDDEECVKVLEDFAKTLQEVEGVQ